MDITNRNVNSPAGPVGQVVNNPKHRRSSDSKWQRLGIASAVLAVMVLVVALIVLIASSNKPKSEDSYVDTSKLQAVILNSGQVYFGNISNLNSKYLTLNDIYYFQTSKGDNDTTNLTLVKLGCEIHKPYDMIVFNKDQVTFWENLQDNGDVAKAVAGYKQQHPDGKCVDQSSANKASSTEDTSTSNPINSNSSSSTKAKQ